MVDITDERFEPCKRYIAKRHEMGVDWALIRYLSTKPNDATHRHLLEQLEDRVYDGWPMLDVNGWFELFDAVKVEIEEFEATGMDGWSGVSNGGNSHLDMSCVYDDPNSCWNRYKYKLLNIAKFSTNTVRSIQLECDWIVKNLSPDSIEATKGLVVGNVQSGKTANMAGVIAMAADLGYNFFIVLSGTITNLREQTAKRLYSDLALMEGNADQNLWMTWTLLENPGPKSSGDKRLSALKLSAQINGESNPNRYLTVCLKNKKRLRDLLGWLQTQDSLINTGLLKVVIIDDECDQAGVNTANVASGEQTRIFQLIKGLCDHAKPAPKDQVCRGERYKTANYIAYSATPYANILNDGDEKTSLFPRDFICSLPVSTSYWGPNRFFGAFDEDKPFESLPFVNEIAHKDLVEIRRIHSKQTSDAPQSLQDAVKWFVCASAVRRVSGSKKPVSMLVHTSNRTDDHSAVAHSIEKYLNGLRERTISGESDVLREVEETYIAQSKSLSVEDFDALFPDYEPKYGETVKAIPPFATIRDSVAEILSEKIANIKLADEDADNSYEFSQGVHLCIDNSVNNAVQINAPGEEFTLRIKYPEDGQNVPTAPLFIIVGGNTLSRGLTLEGLVCSYFLRTVRQSDSLMQMGRWFGYRFGYELLPRVWMTEDTLAKFCLLNAVDLDLRRSLTEAMEAGLPPDQMIPCIRDTSDVISNFTLTSPKKMQMAEVAEADYGGKQQVVVTYDTDENALEDNENSVRKFLSWISGFTHPSSYSMSSYYVAGVEWSIIKQFLKGCHFSPHGRDFKNPELMFSYVEKTLSGRPWTVVVSGTAVDPNVEAFEFSPGFSVGKVGRRINKNYGNYISFKHVTSPTDFVCDINHGEDCVQGTEPFVSAGSRASIGYYRSRASLYGKDRTPVLIVNCISKDYLNEKCGTSLSRDVFGIAFYFPPAGERGIGSYTKLRVGNLSMGGGTESEVDI